MTTQADEKCIADECERPGYSRSMCLMHYKRWRKYGDPNARLRVSSAMSADERLRFHGWTVTESGCWEWSGRRVWSGYGQVTIDGIDQAAHRVALATWGELREGEFALHSCDNPPCINPAHLRSGTIQDNANDMVERDRSGGHKLRGERNVNAKLTDAEVAEIRELLPAPLGGQKILADRYGVSESNISAIKRNKTRVQS